MQSPPEDHFEITAQPGPRTAWLTTTSPVSHEQDSGLRQLEWGFNMTQQSSPPAHLGPVPCMTAQVNWRPQLELQRLGTDEQSG